MPKDKATACGATFHCGTQPDGCGGMVDCGSCDPNWQTCLALQFQATCQANNSCQPEPDPTWQQDCPNAGQVGPNQTMLTLICTGQDMPPCPQSKGWTPKPGWAFFCCIE